jgi:hypothetical protein
MKRRDTGTEEIIPQTLYAAAKQRLENNIVLANSVEEVESAASDGSFAMGPSEGRSRSDARIKSFKAIDEPLARRVVIAKSY